MGNRGSNHFLRFAQRLALVAIPAAGCANGKPPTPDAATTVDASDAAMDVAMDVALDHSAPPDDVVPFDSGVVDASLVDDARMCPAAPLLEPPAPPPPIPDAADTDATDGSDSSDGADAADSDAGSARARAFPTETGFDLHYPSGAVSRCVSTAHADSVVSLSVLSCAGATTATTGYFMSQGFMGILPCDCSLSGYTTMTCAGDGGADGGVSCELLLPTQAGSRCWSHLATCDGQTARIVVCSPMGGALPPPDLHAAA